MSGRSFIDTNILIYTDDKDSPDKQRCALDVVNTLRRNGNGVLSTQVLQEYFVAVTRKLAVDTEIARRKVELFSSLNLVQINLDTVLGAIDLHRLHQFSLWDALIIRCALDSKCQTLFTEDLQHGQKISGLEIVNPFK